MNSYSLENIFPIYTYPLFVCIMQNPKLVSNNHILGEILRFTRRILKSDNETILEN